MNAQLTGHAAVEFTDAGFESDVLGADGVVMVDFWAAWCPPCRALAPAIEEIAAEYAGRATVGKLDVDANQETAVKYGIRSIPTLLFFKRGEVVGKLVGASRKGAITEVLDRLID